MSAEGHRPGGVGCDACGHLSCVCATIRDHADGCRFRTAVVCPVGIECDHGYDVCPVCDPRTCSSGLPDRKNPVVPALERLPEQWTVAADESGISHYAADR